MNMLNEVRRRRELKFKDLSAKTGYSIGHLGNIFSGRLVVISNEAKSKIAKALGVSKDLIFIKTGGSHV